MSRRSSGGSGLADRFVEIDPDRVATAVVVGGTGLAIGAVLLGGFVPTGRLLVGLLYSLAALFPILGLAIAGYALGWVWTVGPSSRGAMLEDDPPEAGVTRTDYRVGRETAQLLDTAAGDWYRCWPSESTADVRRRLVDGATRVLTTKRGFAPEAAREAVESGTWTGDPVAAAFLADDLRQPVRERLHAAIDPGAAYQRRVRRTLAAIEAIDDGRSGIESADADSRDGPEVAR
ncbi:DUF7269 family protein [Halosolutus halophilus]|uniref:DUF7269 family protein n=1 Tax=Halosolutus halophilus TaxID=1552990 RepID=UPI0022352965|nr:hypothetical protein [Halosolutus halophilus]